MFPLRSNVKVVLTVALVACYSISFRFTIAAEIQQSQQQQLQQQQQQQQNQHRQQRQQPPPQQQQQLLSQQQFSKNYKYINNDTSSPAAITSTNNEFFTRRIDGDTDDRQQHHTSSYNNNLNHISNSINKKETSALHNQTLNKLLRYLNRRQQELIKRYPGSLLAVARALKMAIYECQYQMRHELWDCPVYSFSVKPTEMFGKLISRSFKEASFIHALLSSAIAHSIARACTESMIITCGGKRTRDGGLSEDIDFGLHFAQQFMEATHEMQSGLSSVGSFATNSSNTNAIGRRSIESSGSSSLNSIDWNPNNNIIGTGSGELNNAVVAQPHNQHQQHQHATSGGQIVESTGRERKIRNMINAHNDEAGRLHVLAGMRRECRCHGASGACSWQTCWVKLPPFREVASKLHDSLDQAIRVMYVTHNSIKPLTSNSGVEKSNKKRSSSVNPVNGLTRLTPLNYESLSLNSLTSDTASIIGSRQRGAKRRIDSADNCEDCYRTPVNNGGDNSGTDDKAQSASAPSAASAASSSSATTQGGLGSDQSNWNSLSIAARDNAPVVKKRPVARSIGTNANKITPSKLDLLFYEESPDFCVASERYNIKGTKGRICSESPNEVNSCKTLCCDRGYKTEVREDKYKCDCQFEYCCKLNCKICTRRKVIHKCL